MNARNPYGQPPQPAYGQPPQPAYGQPPQPAAPLPDLGQIAAPEFAETRTPFFSGAGLYTLVADRISYRTNADGIGLIVFDFEVAEAAPNSAEPAGSKRCHMIAIKQRNGWQRRLAEVLTPLVAAWKGYDHTWLGGPGNVPSLIAGHADPNADGLALAGVAVRCEAVALPSTKNPGEIFTALNFSQATGPLPASAGYARQGAPAPQAAPPSPPPAYQPPPPTAAAYAAPSAPHAVPAPPPPGIVPPAPPTWTGPKA